MTTSRSKKPKKEKPIPNNIKHLCLSMFQRMRRLQEANYAGDVTCISCGQVMNWKDSQGGHYLSRTVEATCIEPDNVWPQCPSCNGYKAGNVALYRINLVKRIGVERVERLENMMMASKGDEEAKEKLSAEDLFQATSKKGKVYWNERYKEFKEEVKKLESEY